MSERKVEKRLERWRNSRQSVPKGDLEMVLDFYFAGRWTHGPRGGGSHEYRIRHEYFGEFANCLDGMIHIPVRHGKQVRHQYLKVLLVVIDKIRETGR